MHQARQLCTFYVYQLFKQTFIFFSLSFFLLLLEFQNSSIYMVNGAIYSSSVLHRELVIALLLAGCCHELLCTTNCIKLKTCAFNTKYRSVDRKWRFNYGNLYLHLFSLNTTPIYICTFVFTFYMEQFIFSRRVADCTFLYIREMYVHTNTHIHRNWEKETKRKEEEEEKK